MIKNKTDLLSNDLSKSSYNLRKTAITALEKIIKALRPENLIKNNVRLKSKTLIVQNSSFDLIKVNKIYLIGGGKATLEMVSAFEQNVLNNINNPYEGIINIPENQKDNKYGLSEKIIVNYASHPMPNKNGVKGVKAMLNMVEGAKQNDLIISFISGGGSALLPLPRESISLKDLKRVNSLLLASGASIHQINVIRKHLSGFKGGNLAKRIHNSSGATLISLIISDVVGNDLDIIASGPTVPDSSSFQDAVNFLKNYQIYDKVSESVRNVLNTGIENRDLETPKQNDPCFANIHNFLIGSVKSGIPKLKKFLKKNGYRIDYFSDKISGEAKDFGSLLSEQVFGDLNNKTKKRKKKALIGTGELTVTIKGNGIGGRNQEMLLSFIDSIINKELQAQFVLLAVNFDGKEGNSNAMGAIVDNEVIKKVRELKLQPLIYLENNDSNTFFKKVGGVIISGPTGINVNDMILVVGS